MKLLKRIKKWWKRTLQLQRDLYYEEHNLYTTKDRKRYAKEKAKKEKAKRQHIAKTKAGSAKKSKNIW